MGKRGRPRRETVVVPVKLYLHPGEDDDLIAWFAGIPVRMRAQATAAALRGGSLQVGAGVDLPDDDEVADLLGDRLW